MITVHLLNVTPVKDAPVLESVTRYVIGNEGLYLCIIPQPVLEWHTMTQLVLSMNDWIWQEAVHSFVEDHFCGTLRRYLEM
jgi:hypothetical protein